MTPMISVLVALLAMGWTSVACAGRFNDAGNLAEAVGMVKMTAHVSTVLRDQCVSAFPLLATAIDDELEQWRGNESAVLEQVDRRWHALEREGLEGGRILADGAKAVRSDLAFIERMDDDEAGATVEDYCRRSFRDLAAGAWRVRTPDAYRLIEQAAVAVAGQ
ncbi:MAG: hypothetical protein QM803_16840 [Rhodocyclaceae bacterium]